MQLKIYSEYCRLPNLTGKIIGKFYCKERGQNKICTEMSEVQEKPEKELEPIIAITETALIIDETITSVERNRQYQEARTETVIGLTRTVPTSQIQR